jgi:glycosidase
MTFSTLPVNRYCPLGLPVSARAHRDLQLPAAALNPPPGRSLFALRQVAAALQQRRPLPTAGAARLNLFAWLCTAQRLAIAHYLEGRGARVTTAGLELAGARLPVPDLAPVLTATLKFFPPAEPGAKSLDPGQVAGLATAELLVLAVQSGNRAAEPFAPLFTPDELDATCPWRQVLSELDRMLAGASAPGPLAGSLLALLEGPMRAAPDSLEGQLRYIREHWAGFLPPSLLAGLEQAFAVLAEEQRARGGGPGPAPVPTFGGWGEPEAFSRDAEWMSSVVLVAKSVYVWLDQLSRRYGREILRLDQIPDQELDRLAGWGFSALWLIGIWRRSTASCTIKQRMGNPEAVASAYSLEDYVVADDLGADEALGRLEERCRQRGIRLACDVVPNHTGIDSRWVREHPDWFIQVEHPPYPAYQFNDPDLSTDPGVGLFIEDGYWNHSDAAVVFRHLDRPSGKVRYIYHGNDGTHLPWNDTAQLNFLLPAVREAMIRTILQVARRFRIIRFDAAMTLAKRHFQRLWFPLPGGGAGVPSRAEHALAREAFEAAFPVEFWREVVDRIAAEVPDTLLLAEAFWLMEGYFVRTLGMHRVYNSAFMNMLKREENAKYRSVLKNVLEFNPEILKRFVNFMNNPDEATAVEQFGKGDKYFGVAVLLATLPGLPMFGHGQLEGLREKYGMEYRRAYLDEAPDPGFVAHHEAQICPLLKDRHLFSEADHFELFDFETDGQVNEDVFAYTTARHGRRSLVVYHNHAGETGGWLRRSVTRAAPGPDGTLQPRQMTLAQALGLDPGGQPLWRCREHRSGQEYLLATDTLAGEGLPLQLGPYEYRVFLDIRPQTDVDGSWTDLCRHLDGRSVPDLERERRRLRYRFLHADLAQALKPELRTALGRELPVPGDSPPAAKTRLRNRLVIFYRELAAAGGLAGDPEAAAAAALAELDGLRRLIGLSSRSSRTRATLDQIRTLFTGSGGAGSLDLLPLLLALLGPGAATLRGRDPDGRGADWMEPFLLEEGLPATPQPELLRLVAIALDCGAAWGQEQPAGRRSPLWKDPRIHSYLLVHEAQGTTWFDRDRCVDLVTALTTAATLVLLRDPALSRSELTTVLAQLGQRQAEILDAAAAAGYRLDNFLESI